MNTLPPVQDIWSNFAKDADISILNELVRDCTTQQPIVLATDIYSEQFPYVDRETPLSVELLHSSFGIALRPRVGKTAAQQLERTHNKAEVFTPAWVCNLMNNYCDEQWFGRADVFNVPAVRSWTVQTSALPFANSASWKQYVVSPRLEITCGEAPYLVSRYNAADGTFIPIPERIGILDRKLRVVTENCSNEVEWLHWAERAYQSVYGYEFQGDSLLIARFNLWATFVEYMREYWHRAPTVAEQRKIANIIAWNLWQMDGLTCRVPFRECAVTGAQMDLFDAWDDSELASSPTVCSDCQIKTWRNSERPIAFKCLTERNSPMKFDFVIGNPPYQEEAETVSETNGQRARTNVFQYFQLSADKIARQGTCLIYPGVRWMHYSGKGLKQFGKDLINDPKLSRIEFYVDASEVFGNAAEIDDGVTIIIKNMSKISSGFTYTYRHKAQIMSLWRDNPGEDIININPSDCAIIDKLQSFVHTYKLDFLHQAILPRSLFGIESDFVEKYTHFVEPYREGKSVDYSAKIKLLTNDKAGSAGRAKWFVVDKSSVSRNSQYIGEFQVVVSSAHPGGQQNRDNQMEIVDNHSAFGRSRLGLRSFKTLAEARNFFNYANAYLIRFAFLMTDEALSSLGKLVPDLGNYRDDNGLIDFSADIDEQLFRLADISEQEIAYIKDKVNNLR